MKSLKEALVLDGKSDEITGEGCYFHVLTHVSGQSGRCWGLWLPCCGKNEEGNGSLSMMAHGGIVTVFLIQPLFCGGGFPFNNATSAFTVATEARLDH